MLNYLKVSVFLALFATSIYCQDSSTTVETTAGGTTATGQTTVSGATTGASGATTASTCADDPNTDCSQYKSLCSNAKYTPLLQQFCPKTCGWCEAGGTTVAPPACSDSSTNCANWNKNGFCDSTFYTCANKKSYCAKTCNLCTTNC